MKSRSSVATVSIVLLLVLLGFVLADLSILGIRDKFLPTQPPPQRGLQASHRHVPPDRNSYNIVTSRNIFNSDQKIGDPFGTPGKGAPDAPPVPTALPIQLTGTIVHANPTRSVATILLKGKGTDQVAVKLNSVIPDDLGTVTKIERSRVTFRNHASQRLEYSDIPDDMKISFGSSAPRGQQVGEVLKKSDTDFELHRDDVDRLTGNLPELLQQARAIPRMGPGGQIECFSLADIAPNSIYERLGLKRGDCIKSVNGEKIDSPGKAMEMYNALRGQANSINLGVERSGRDENFNYNIVR